MVDNKVLALNVARLNKVIKEKDREIARLEEDNKMIRSILQGVKEYLNDKGIDFRSIEVAEND